MFSCVNISQVFQRVLRTRPLVSFEYSEELGSLFVALFYKFPAERMLPSTWQPHVNLLGR